MATRKLKAKLDLDTSEARRKLRRDLEASSGGGPSGGGPGGGGPSASLDRVASSAGKAADSFNSVNASALRLTRGFAGIAVGLATSYAANYVDNPNAKAALGYAGNAMAGAMAGAMFGGIPGAVIGGAAGIAKTYMDNEGEKSAMSKDFEQSEAIYAAVRANNAKFQELSDTKDGANIAGNLAEAKKIIEKYTENTADFVKQVRDELKKMNPDKEKIATLRRNIDYNRGEIQRYEGLVKNLEELANKPTPAARASLTATDSLSKVGGLMAIPAAASPVPAETSSGSAETSSGSAETSSGSAETSSGSALRGFAFSVPTIPADTADFGSRAEGLAEGAAAALKSANERIEKIDADQLQVLNEIKETLKSQKGTAWQ